MKREPTGSNKDSRDPCPQQGVFQEYMELFPSRRLAIAMKEEQHAGKIAQQCRSSQPIATTELSSPTQKPVIARQSPSPPSQPFHSNQKTSSSCICSLLVGNISYQKNLTKAQRRLLSPLKVRPCKQTCLTNLPLIYM